MHKHTPKHIRQNKPMAQHLKDISFVAHPESHHYPKGFPRSFSQMYSSSLSGNGLLDDNIGRKIGE